LRRRAFENALKKRRRAFEKTGARAKNRAK
jgi:hypothetical protein